jgi:hypothetical protein
MHRMEPPPLATWMLEHLTPSDRDEALAGDLLEVYRSGRSNQWYWRQVLAACAVAWFRNLRSRLPLLIFAFLFATVAPAWAVLIEKVESLPQIGLVFSKNWPLAAMFWIGLNAIFLWSGMLVFIAAHAEFRRKLHRQKLLRGFLLSLLLFILAYATTFVLTNLLWYPGLSIQPSAMTPLAELVDLRLWANAVRVPYWIALVGALWGAIPQAIRTMELRVDASSALTEYSEHSGVLTLASEQNSFPAIRLLLLTVTAGLINAMILSFLLLRLPEDHAPSLVSLCIRSIFYVSLGALAGVGGSWFYWSNSSKQFRNRSPLPFSLFALVCAAGWIWIPSMVLFSEQVSAMTAVVAMIGALTLASGLRNATRGILTKPTMAQSVWEYNNSALFAESLYQSPLDLRGYGIAIAIYAAGWALATHSNYTAAVLLASSAFLFAWERIAPIDVPFENRIEYKRSIVRLAWVVVPAILLTMWALLDGVQHREHALAQLAALQHASAKNAKLNSHGPGGVGLSGYESIILWPVPEKQKILAPLPPGANMLQTDIKRPLLLRFTGAYWYFQSPDTQPGPRAFETHGTPLAANIHANNRLPLLMEAHQNLSAPIRVSSCREVDVTVESRDANSGLLAMAVLLRDSSNPQKPELYLGQQPVLSSEPYHLNSKSAPEEEELHFFFPARTNIRAFDQITVMFFPETGALLTAPQIAIDQFSLMPR